MEHIRTKIKKQQDENVNGLRKLEALMLDFERLEEQEKRTLLGTVEEVENELNKFKAWSHIPLKHTGLLATSKFCRTKRQIIRALEPFHTRLLYTLVNMQNRINALEEERLPPLEPLPASIASCPPRVPGRAPCCVPCSEQPPSPPPSVTSDGDNDEWKDIPYDDKDCWR